jgi:hypothetical protein
MTTDPCPKCAQVHDPALCQGHVIKDPITREPIDPRQCAKTPVKGSTVCRSHGAARGTPAAAAAEQRLLLRRAVLEAETLGLPREVDPHTALLEELHRTAGAVQWLGAVVADLKREHVGGDVGPAQVWVRFLGDERDRLVKVAKTCVDVGIEERRVRLAESAGAQLAAVVRAVLDRLELSDGQRLLALQVVPEEFRRLGGDVVEGEVVA